MVHEQTCYPHTFVLNEYSGYWVLVFCFVLTIQPSIYLADWHLAPHPGESPIVHCPGDPWSPTEVEGIRLLSSPPRPKVVRL